MSELTPEIETEQFQVENSDDLNTAIGTDTSEDTPGEVSSTEDKAEETTDVKVVAKSEEKDKKPTRRERRNQRQANENKELREELAGLKAERAKENTKPEEPDIDNFEDYSAYTDANKKYMQDMKSHDDQETKAKELKVDEQPELFNADDLNDAVEDGAEDYEDFETLIRAEDLALTGEILADVLESEIASDILYHLANNKEETRKIAGMSERARGKALLKIELSLESKPRGTVKRKKVSSAPEPITPVDGNAPKATSLDDDDISYAEYEKEFNRKQTAHQSNGWA